MSRYPYLKRFLIACLIAIVIIAVSCVFLWNSDSDALLYIMWLTWAAVDGYGYYLKCRMDGRL